MALGAFHIEMAFFSAIGKVIAESGGPYILQESEALAKGSIKSFITGKNYKRCKRLHEILSLAFEVLHFERFLSLESDTRYVHHSLEMEEALEKYHKFCQETGKGAHGKTAQFWIHYVNLLHLYHDFSRSVREGDLQLYISKWKIFTFVDPVILIII